MHQRPVLSSTNSGLVRARSLPPTAWALLMAAVFYACFFSHLGALGLVGPDEPRYAAVAREMVESGDWVTPRLDGQPWFEKPALYYWAAALVFRALGVSEFAARLPSALAATLAALALAWAARHFYGHAATQAVLLIFPTCVGAFAFARAVTTDMLFSAALAAAMVAAAAAIRDTLHPGAATGHTGLAWRAAFGFFLGAATLVKGPAAILLAAGSVGLWLLGTRRWRVALRLAHPAAILAFCVTALPWYVLCAARNPGFLRDFLFEHNFERYFTPVFRHEQPFWFFGPVLLLGMLPWTALLAATARDAARRWPDKSWADPPGFFFACWAVFPVVFFSFSRSKLPGYVLPSVPPLALLLAGSVSRAIERNALFPRAAFGALGVTFVAFAVSASYWLKRLPVESGFAHPRSLLAELLLVTAGGLAVALLGMWPRQQTAALLAAALLMAVLVEVANRRVLPQLDPFLSSRTAARAAQSRRLPPEAIAVYRLHRAWRYGLNFYLHRELPEWNSESSALPHSQWLYTSAAGAANLQREGFPVLVVERFAAQAWLVRLGQ